VKKSTVVNSRDDLLKRFERAYQTAFTKKWNQMRGLYRASSLTSHTQHRLLKLNEGLRGLDGVEVITFEVKAGRSSALDALKAMRTALNNQSADGVQAASRAGNATAREAAYIDAMATLDLDAEMVATLTGDERTQWEEEARQIWMSLYDLAE
jgi:hypothetical protein